MFLKLSYKDKIWNIRKQKKWNNNSQLYLLNISLRQQCDSPVPTNRHNHANKTSTLEQLWILLYYHIVLSDIIIIFASKPISYEKSELYIQDN